LWAGTNYVGDVFDMHRLKVLILLVVIGFAPASFAAGIVLDSLRVDYQDGSYLDVTFDSMTVFEEGDYVLLNQDYVHVIGTTILHSFWNGDRPHAHGSPVEWTLQVDASGVPTMDFIIYGDNNGHSSQAFYPTWSKYFGADDYLNGKRDCILENGCPATSFVLSYSDGPSEFTLTYNAGADGSINGTSPQTVAYDASGSAVTAEPDPNHHFVNWSDASTANPRTDTNVKAVVDVTANFAIDTFAVTSSVDGTGGDIAPLGEQQVVWNQTAEFTLAAADGYMSDGVSGTCGGSLDGLTFTTDPITAGCTVVASFKLKPDLIFDHSFEDPPKLVFITSVQYSGGLGGLEGADLKCNTLATAAGLPGTYAAWLSTNIPTVKAKDRIGGHAWLRVDGAVVADNLADLIDGSIQNPINIDENGTTTTSSVVWTGTNGSGVFAGAGTNPCWAPGGGEGGLLGNPAATTNGDWSDGTGWLSGCSNASPIYCFGL
jgi:hypothetical protein